METQVLKVKGILLNLDGTIVDSKESALGCCVQQNIS